MHWGYWNKVFHIKKLWQTLARALCKSPSTLLLQTRTWDERGDDTAYFTGLVCRANEMNDSYGSALGMLKIYMGLR